jgi:hypothetical protein
MKIIRTSIAVAAGSVITLGALVAGQASAVSTGNPDTPAHRTHWMKAPCVYDEAIGNCQWNAAVRGSGGGESYYTVRAPLFDKDGYKVGRVQCTYYVNDPDLPKACTVTRSVR